jgi:hypothetical protein
MGLINRERVYNGIGILSIGIIALTLGWLIVTYVEPVPSQLINANETTMSPTLKISEKETKHFYCVISERGDVLESIQCYPKGE